MLIYIYIYAYKYIYMYVYIYYRIYIPIVPNIDIRVFNVKLQRRYE